ncbi:hypothetical protein PHYPSEUDO_002828 [Phytophthora pseudosyringae]|uniref:Uncharacterized protein n=1 Tax=Phytophthora pseudosyringae TaxID=221518 RepID=A0A8T1VWA3_9STRA|nr:hypothetical protein PHYPSEUDO_002828 [Phytophthora pseudosyringae]
MVVTPTVCSAGAHAARDDADEEAVPGDGAQETLPAALLMPPSALDESLVAHTSAKPLVDPRVSSKCNLTETSVEAFTDAQLRVRGVASVQL